MDIIPIAFQDLLKDETRAFAHLATLMRDGSPQVTPIWFNSDSVYILINSAAGRTKDRNIRRNPRVALAIMDPKNPYRYIQVRGRVVEITTEGADAHIDALAGKYTGTAYYGNRRPGEKRITYKILIENVTTMG